MVITEQIIDFLDEACFTTDTIARHISASEADTRALCRALARQGRIFLASYGWNGKLAWADIDFADDIVNTQNQDDPWYMSRIDRYEELCAC